jgi:VanZ family protein
MDLLHSPRIRWSLAGIYFLVLSHSLLAPAPLWFLGAFEPAVEAAVTHRVSDYWKHLMAFQLLAMLVCWARGPSHSPAVPICLLALFGYALLSEMLQTLIPGRSWETHDVLANVVGILAGWWIGATLSRWSTPTSAC